ncbi:uncharacterized protein LOC143468624 [Clavelina lepadiformis]|uniref:uncharacterized protein LOC143468624 n=1 Tax=Clavelina lepadiformis TaxID=159417 RepID=UPI004041836B
MFYKGIWGSAFSILFKEIFESKAKERWKWKTLWKSLKSILRGDETDQLSDENVAYLSDAAATVITEPADFYSHMEHSMKMLREVPLAAINDDFDDGTDEEDDAVKRNQTNLKVNPTPTKTNLQLENQEPRLESGIFTPLDEEAPEQERPVHQLDPKLEVPELAYSITNPFIGKGGSADESDEEEENEKDDEKSTSGGGISGWLVEKIFGEDNLQTRGQRTAKIFNYMRDVELNAHSDLYEQYAGSISMSSVDNAFQKINEPLEVRKKKFSLADAGIAFNSPYPPICYVQREALTSFSRLISAQEKKTTWILWRMGKDEWTAFPKNKPRYIQERRTERMLCVPG